MKGDIMSTQLSKDMNKAKASGSSRTSRRAGTKSRASRQARNRARHGK